MDENVKLLNSSSDCSLVETSCPVDSWSAANGFSAEVTCSDLILPALLFLSKPMLLSGLETIASPNLSELLVFADSPRLECRLYDVARAARPRDALLGPDRTWFVVSLFLVCTNNKLQNDHFLFKATTTFRVLLETFEKSKHDSD